MSGKRTNDDRLALFLNDRIGTVETNDYVSKGEGGMPEYTGWMTICAVAPGDNISEVKSPYDTQIGENRGLLS